MRVLLLLVGVGVLLTAAWWISAEQAGGRAAGPASASPATPSNDASAPRLGELPGARNTDGSARESRTEVISTAPFPPTGRRSVSSVTVFSLSCSNTH